jgi:hypothetical protein
MITPLCFILGILLSPWVLTINTNYDYQEISSQPVTNNQSFVIVALIPLILYYLYESFKTPLLEQLEPEELSHRIDIIVNKVFLDPTIKEHLKNKVGYIALRNKSQWCIGEDLVEENGEIVLKRCTITASYGTNETKFIHCKKHSIEGEVDNRSTKCEKCKKLYHDKKITIKNINQAIWGTTTKERCTTHKNDNDIMLGSKECIHKDCNKIASFGPENKRLYCSNHNEKNYPSSIKRPECEREGCLNEASYGNEKEGRVRCSIDKRKNDIDFKNIRICLKKFKHNF